MGKILLNIKIEPTTKIKAQALANEFGMTLSAVINAQLKQFVREQQLILKKVPTISSTLEEMLGPIERDISRGKNISKKVSTSKELVQYFRSL